MRTLVAGLSVLTLATGWSGSGCEEGAGFSNSMASAGGHVSPKAALVAAAGESPANYPFVVPADGWSAARETAAQQTFHSAGVEMTVLRLEDDTWLVESGRCVSG